MKLFQTHLSIDAFVRYHLERQRETEQSQIRYLILIKWQINYHNKFVSFFFWVSLLSRLRFWCCVPEKWLTFIYRLMIAKVCVRVRVQINCETVCVCVYWSYQNFWFHRTECKYSIAINAKVFAVLPSWTFVRTHTQSIIIKSMLCLYKIYMYSWYG